MIDDDVVAIAPGLCFGEYYTSASCCIHFGTRGCGEIHARVEGGGVVKGIAPIPKSRGHLSEVFVGHGHDRGDGIDGVDAVFGEFLQFYKAGFLGLGEGFELVCFLLDAREHFAIG